MAYDNIIKSYSKDRHILGEELPLDTPYTILIDISDMCNLRCKYCFRYDESIKAEDYRKNRLMDWETFLRIVEQMKEKSMNIMANKEYTFLVHPEANKCMIK